MQLFLLFQHHVFRWILAITSLATTTYHIITQYSTVFMSELATSIIGCRCPDLCKGYKLYCCCLTESHYKNSVVNLLQASTYSLNTAN